METARLRCMPQSDIGRIQKIRAINIGQKYTGVTGARGRGSCFNTLACYAE